MTMAGTDRAPLRRMVSRAAAPADDPPPTPARVLRIALTRAAARAAGLSVTALGVSDDRLALADLLARLEDGWLFLSLEGDGGPGLVAIDRGFLGAVTEMQMRRKLSAAEPDSRPLTGADAALAEPLVAAMLGELRLAAGGTSLDGWVDGWQTGARLADLRALGLALPERDFRLIGLSVWLGAGDRQGQLMIALPEAPVAPPDADRADRAAAWAQALADNVLAAPAAVTAILTRLRLPLADVQAFALGQQIALPGVRLTAVRIESPDGRVVGRGRLGQSGGMRAIRIEAEEPQDLTDGPGLLAGP